MDKRFFAVIAVIVAVFVGVAVVTNHKKDDTAKNDTTSASQGTSHSKGSNDAKVTLIEYGDYQCPACEQYYPIINQVLDAYGDKVKFEFRNYPLTNMHPNAYAAARAAEAASLQNKFWEMHDMLYDSINWQTWTVANNPQTNFNSYAQTLGLDVAKFQSDFSSSKVNDLIRADMAKGDAIKITATPTFVLNGKKLDSVGASVDAFKAIIDPELKK